MSGFRWTEARVRKALGMEGGSEATVYSAVSTDSRTLPPGALLVALRGPRFDAHDFVAQALTEGASAAVVDRPVDGVAPDRLFQVKDTLEALGRLARHRRRALPARVVGITGSLGKTTTKELTRGALEGTFRVHATPANLNNRVGVPLTILDTPDDTQVLILEMGSSEEGEIGALTRIGEPDLGVITTVTESHIQGLGSLEGVFREKLALLEGIRPPKRVLVGDAPPDLADRARAAGARVRVAGWSERADGDLRPEGAVAGGAGTFRFSWSGQAVELRVPGRHGVACALLALGVARELGADPEAAARGVSAVPVPPLRGELRAVGGLTLLLDCYNAGPESVREAARILESHGRGRPRVAILGTMRELGAEEDRRHREVLADVLGLELDLVVATGAFARAARATAMVSESPPDPAGASTAAADRLIVAADPDGGYELLRDRLAGNEVVLLKASRGIRLESLVPRFEEDFGGRGAGEPTGRTATDPGRQAGEV